MNYKVRNIRDQLDILASRCPNPATGKQTRYLASLLDDINVTPKEAGLEEPLSKLMASKVISQILNEKEAYEAFGL